MFIYSKDHQVLVLSNSDNTLERKRITHFKTNLPLFVELLSTGPHHFPKVIFLTG